MTFQAFVAIIHNGIATGAIRLSDKLSDFDLAVMFAVGRIGDRKGYPCEFTVEEVYAEIQQFAPYLLEGGAK
jgi:hypothetical protein